MKHVAELKGERLPGDIGRLPYITVHAFCETAAAQAELEKSKADRRMARVEAAVYGGGVATAIELYEKAPTPNLIILETEALGDALLAQLDSLAAVCDSDTKVVVIGYTNDISLYRTLLNRGVSDYLPGPIQTMDLIERISVLYTKSSSTKLGRCFAFIGAKGGAGSSAIAQNVASAIARTATARVVLADLDLPFGSSSLNLDLEDRQGVAEAVHDASRLDEVLLERLMTGYEPNLNVLTSPGSLARGHDLAADAFDRLVDIAQASVPYLVLDVPHLWTGWSQTLLTTADEVIITAAPDLANLRNAKHLIETLKRTRPNDGAPKLILNQVGMPKRTEIKPKDFAQSVGLEVAACIPFEPATFSKASINGKMIADISAKSGATKTVAEFAITLVGKPAAKPSKRAWLFRSRQKG